MQQIIMILNYAKYLNAMHVTTVESFIVFFFFFFSFLSLIYAKKPSVFKANLYLSY